MPSRLWGAMDIQSTTRACAIAVAAALAACGADAPRDRSDDATSDVAASAAAADHGHDRAPDVTGGGSEPLEGVGPWTVTASDGSEVTATASSAPLPGTVEMTFEVRGADDAARAPTSVDLVSPTMPMHGVVRFPVVDGRVRIDIPMEGTWAMYVNLDGTGQVSAELLFDVPPGESGGHQHHGGQ